MKRRRGRVRVFHFALAVSALFHLSMITLFSIEMHYDLRPIRYYPFDIVDATRLVGDGPAADPLFTLPAEGSWPFSEGGPGDMAQHLASLPEISLPVMPFEGFGTLTLRQPELSLDPRLTGGTERPRDPWARFGEEIQDLRNTLKSLPLFDDLQSREQGAGLPIHVMPGIDGRIEWLTEPRDRDLLLAAPAIAPLETQALTLAAPATLLFRVAPDGRVTEVIAPADAGEQGPVPVAAAALRRYRFAVLPADGRGEQTGTLTLTPVEVRP